MRVWQTALAVGVLISAWAVAQEPAGEVQEIEQLIAQIERLEEQLAEAQGTQADVLGRQIVLLRQRLEQLEREELFADLRNRERDRVWDLETEITELREQLATEERTIPEPHQALAEGRLAYLRELLKLSRQVATLESPEDLPKAFDVLADMEAVEMRWRMVDTPNLEGAARLFDMARAAAELNNPPALLAALEQASEQRLAVVADAEKLYKEWSEHRRIRERYEDAMDAFWRQFEQARTE